MRSIWVGVAGFFGAVARYQLDTLVARHLRGAFPWGALVVNLSGCFAVGVVVALSAGVFEAHPHLRPALTIGFLGAYTTFSTFSLQAVQLVEAGDAAPAAGYVVASLVVGLAAAWAGLAAGRALA